MSAFDDLVSRVTGAYKTFRGVVILLADGSYAKAGANGGLEVEFPAGATAPLPADAATQTTLAAVLAKLIAAPATEGKQDALNGYTVPGTWYPSVQIAPDDSAIIRAEAGTLRTVIATNRTAVTIWIMLFDSATVPGDGTFPRVPVIAVPASSTVELAYGGLALANGLSWAASSTYGSLTITAATAAVVSAEIV